MAKDKVLEVGSIAFDTLLIEALSFHRGNPVNGQDGEKKEYILLSMEEHVELHKRKIICKPRLHWNNDYTGMRFTGQGYGDTVCYGKFTKYGMKVLVQFDILSALGAFDNWYWQPEDHAKEVHYE